MNNHIIITDKWSTFLCTHQMKLVCGEFEIKNGPMIGSSYWFFFFVTEAGKFIYRRLSVWMYSRGSNNFPSLILFLRYESNDKECCFICYRMAVLPPQYSYQFIVEINFSCIKEKTRVRVYKKHRTNSWMKFSILLIKYKFCYKYCTIQTVQTYIYMHVTNARYTIINIFFIYRIWYEAEQTRGCISYL